LPASCLGTNDSSKGTVENSISSSFSKADWEEWLQKNVA
jgi:hypothetical protein